MVFWLLLVSGWWKQDLWVVWSWSQELSLPLSNFLVMDFCSSSWWTRGGDGPLSKAKWLLADGMGGRGDWIVSHCVEIFGVDLCSW